MYQDSTFMSSLMTYLLNKFNIQIRTVGPYIHQSLQAENSIKSLSNILTKHLTNLGQMQLKYLSLGTFVYNTFNIPNLGNYSPYELACGRKPRPLINLDSNPDIKVFGTFREYYEFLNKRIKYLQNILFNFKSKRLAMINKDRIFFQYKSRRPSLHHFPINKSSAHRITEGDNQICRSCSNIENHRSQ